jgi:hypothetical protein
MKDSDIERLLKYDFSQGTEAFADELLRRSLYVAEDGAELSDEQVELLSAAGDIRLFLSSQAGELSEQT